MPSSPGWRDKAAMSLTGRRRRAEADFAHRRHGRARAGGAAGDALIQGRPSTRAQSWWPWAAAPVTGTIIVGPTVHRSRWRRTMKLYREESFGPGGLPSIRAAGVTTSTRCELANDTDYGLSAAVFSQNDVDRALNGGAPDPNRASATSTARPCRTRRRCHSAA
jgi:hypothetical protein